MYERPYDQPQGVGAQMTGQQGMGQPGMMQGNDMRQMTQRLSEERVQKEFLAQRLSREAVSQWQKAIEGIVALPTALTLGWASAALYVVSFLTRGFEVFGVAAEDIRRSGEFNGQFQRGQPGSFGFQTQHPPGQFGVQQGEFGREAAPGWRPGNLGDRPLGERGNENSEMTSPILPTTPRA